MITQTIPFAKDDHLQGGQCEGCGALAFPPPSICATCLSRDIAPYPLPTSGRLYSYTVVHGKDAPPLVVGYADLSDGLRLFGIVDSPSAPTIDQEIAVRLNPDGPPYCRFVGGAV